MLSRSWDVVAALAVVALGILLTVFIPTLTLVRAAFAVPALLFVPGYLILAALPRQLALRRVEQLTLSVGLSLTLTLLGGLGMSQLPGGIQATSWTIALGVITAIAGGIALFRRWSLGPQAQVWDPPRPVPRTSLLYLGAVGLLAAAFFTARAGVSASSSSFTQFWLMPSHREQSQATLGVRNSEGKTLGYRIEVTLNGAFYTSIPALQLADNERWSTMLELPAGAGSIEARLYRADAPETAYRTVTLELSPP